MARLSRILFILLLFLTSNALAANYYADLTLGTGSNDGSSPANAFQTISAINSAKPFSTEDSLYFKCGATHTMDAQLLIDWDGTDTDNMTIIGGYEGAGDFDCSGLDHGAGTGFPVLDAVNLTGLSEYNAALRVEGDYVKVKDLKVINAPASHAIKLYRVNYSTVEYTWTEDNDGEGIAAEGSPHTTIQYNTVKGNLLRNLTPCNELGGAAIDLVGSSGYFSSSSLVQYNRSLQNYGEGIGVYNNQNTGNPITVQFNIVENNRSAQIHSTDSVTIAQFNLANIFDTDSNGYETEWFGGTYPNCNTRTSNSGGIVFEASSQFPNFASNFTIRGNIVSGGGASAGISVSNGSSSGDSITALVENNTVVDCNPSIITNLLFSNGVGINVRNNIFSFVDSTGTLCQQTDPYSVITYSDNAWSSTPATNCQGTGDYTGEMNLNRISTYKWPSAWDTFTGEEWQLTSNSSSDLKTGGTDLGSSYALMLPDTCDFTAWPITCTTGDPDTYGWPKGAFIGDVLVLSGEYPTSQQSCPDDGVFGFTSSANANCKYSKTGEGDDCDTTYANLDHSMTTGQGGTSHEEDIGTPTCGTTTHIWAKCQDTSTSLISECMEIDIDVAASGGAPPQPAPVSIPDGFFLLTKKAVIAKKKAGTAACTKDTSNLIMDQGTDDTGYNVTSNAIGQSISYGSDWTLYSIDVKFGSSTASCVMDLRIGSSSDLSSYMEEWDNVNIGSGEQNYEFVSVDNDSFTASTYYWIAARQVSGTCLIRGTNATSPYSGGAYYGPDTNWLLGSSATRDWNMRVYQCE